MRPLLWRRVCALIGIFLIGATVFPADLPSKEAAGSEKKTPGQFKEEGSKDVEQLLMQGTEIQGTVEKPHVVYVIPWKDLPSGVEEEVPLHRSFRNEILEPVDREQFQRQWESFSRNPK
ncbi:MAG TPA: hypothetical protein VLY20_01470 [Nitrospiria bacterium]|nr:hypothetical protein [Nitrospiria bacterium]